MNACDLIRLIRGRAGLSQEQFGKALGVARITVAQWELGKHLPRFEKVVQIIESFSPPESVSLQLIKATRGAGQTDEVVNRLQLALSTKNEKFTQQTSTEIEQDEIRAISDSLFDLVIAGEIVFKKGADPTVAAKHIYDRLKRIKLSKIGKFDTVPKIDLSRVADKSGTYDK